MPEWIGGGNERGFLRGLPVAGPNTGIPILIRRHCDGFLAEYALHSYRHSDDGKVFSDQGRLLFPGGTEPLAGKETPHGQGGNCNPQSGRKEFPKIASITNPTA